MSWRAIVLYEDQMQAGVGGSYPLHDLVLAMVADNLGSAANVYDLRSLIDKNPRKGVNNIIRDAAATERRAGSGLLCVVVDRDKVAEHLGLASAASEAEVIAEFERRSDAPSKLRIFFLMSNMEGLLDAIAECNPSLPAPTAKSHNERDRRLNKVAFGMREVRKCVESKQPGLKDLADLLTGLCRTPTTPLLGEHP